MKKIYFWLSLLFICTAFQSEQTAQIQETEHRLALVIGNGKYTGTHKSLTNPTKDADAITTKLKDLGFEVITEKNLTLGGFKNAADRFYNKAVELNNQGDKLVTLIYYAGHGYQVGDILYLIPVNCISRSETDFKENNEYGAYPLRMIVNRLEALNNYLNIFMLDACRNETFEQLLAGRGTDPDMFQGYSAPRLNSPQQRPSGMFYAFATQKGASASDGGTNSPYVEGFMKAVEIPNRSLEEVLKETGKHVVEKTGHRQVPNTENLNFFGSFVFNKTTTIDTDEDGFPDHLDDCPRQPAPNSKNGCPAPFADLMLPIPSGSFSREGNSVTLSSFYMSKYEVTQKQWRDIMGNDPSYFKNCDNCPVEQVSWNDIQTFLQKLNAKTGKNYRLPTEAEWEYAARGGQNYEYAGTNTESSLHLYANFCDKNCTYSWADKNQNDGYENTAPVGSFKSNGYGLYDMSGNVWEWCNDWYGDYSSGAVTNPKGPSTGTFRVLRGGSWYYGAGSCRSANRDNDNPDFRNDSCGFRLAL